MCHSQFIQSKQSQVTHNCNRQWYSHYTITCNSFYWFRLTDFFKSSVSQLCYVHPLQLTCIKVLFWAKCFLSILCIKSIKNNLHQVGITNTLWENFHNESLIAVIIDLQHRQKYHQIFNTDKTIKLYNCNETVISGKL